MRSGLLELSPDPDMALLTVAWNRGEKSAAYGDPWSATHLTRDGKRTLCADNIPTRWPRGPGDFNRLCRKCTRNHARGA